MQTSLDLRDEVAWVTGAGRGLGRAFACALARRGARVVLTSRTLAELDQTADAIIKGGGHALVAQGDVTDRHSMTRVVEHAEQEFGPISLLVGNAGRFGPIGPIWNTDADEWEITISTNICGNRKCIALALPRMIELRRGRIIIVASSTPLHTRPYFSAYSGSKTFLIKLAEEIAPEVRGYGVSVFAIHPGTVLTSMSSRLIDSPEGRKYLKWFAQIFERKKETTCEAAAHLVARLASGQADQFSGSFFDSSKDFDAMIAALERSQRDSLTLRIPLLSRGFRSNSSRRRTTKKSTH